MKKDILILAGGLGTRMKSPLPKVMHRIMGKPILEYITDTAFSLAPERVILLVGNGAEVVVRHFEGKGCIFARQKEQLGTGDAVKSALEFIEKDSSVLILSGDVPLITQKTLNRMFDFHSSSGNAITLLTMILKDPAGYGRIVKDSSGNVEKIVEHKDADEKTREIREVNAGIYVINGSFLHSNVPLIRNDNAQKEYYLTDLINMAYSQSLSVKTILVENENEVKGINNREQLSEIESVMQSSFKKTLMLSGVTIESPLSVHIDSDSVIMNDVTIEPCVTIRGKSIIRSGALIGAHSHIENADIAEGERVAPFSFIKGK